MPGPGDHERIPDPVPPLPLPEFGYDDLEKGERIGTGGDADVYYATVDHEGYTYPVAVKEPRFEGTIQKRVVERFQTEAETWSNLNDHDNIVSVYAWGTEPLPWLALEYMDGGTLDAKIGSVEIDEALWLAGRIAEGIRYGHRHGVAHLDIKPTNVLLRDTGAGTWDYPKVSDWGLAKMLLEHSNSIEGISPTYAAPEQFDSEEYGSPDDITDIYQLGTVVYALVAGEPPFSGSSTAVMQGVLQEEPDPPSEVNSEVPEAVDEVVLKALAKEKDNRYEGVLLFRKELDRVFKEYITGDADTAAPSAASAIDKQTDQTNEKGTDPEEDTTAPDRARTVDTESQTKSSVDNRNESPSPQHSAQKGGDDDRSSLVSRRHTLGILGVGILGGGGLFVASQMNGNNDSSPAATAPTDTLAPSESKTEDAPTPAPSESGTEKQAEIETSTKPMTTTNTKRSAEGGSSWPSSQFDPQNTGYTTGRGKPTSRPTADWRYDAGREIIGGPVVGDGAIFFGNGSWNGSAGKVYAIEKNGSERWSVSKGAITFEGVVKDGTAYFGDWNGDIFALDTTDGSEHWTYSANDSLISDLTVRNSTLYFMDEAGNVHAVDVNTGNRTWRFDTNATRGSFSVSVMDGMVFVGTTKVDTGTVFALSTNDGSKQWEFQTSTDSVSISAKDGACLMSQ